MADDLETRDVPDPLSAIRARTAGMADRLRQHGAPAGAAQAAGATMQALFRTSRDGVLEVCALPGAPGRG